MVMPLGFGKDSMFQPKPFDIEAYIERCKQTYGVPPRVDWVTSYYGGHVSFFYFLQLNSFLSSPVRFSHFTPNFKSFGAYFLLNAEYKSGSSKVWKQYHLFQRAKRSLQYWRVSKQVANFRKDSLINDFEAGMHQMYMNHKYGRPHQV